MPVVDLSLLQTDRSSGTGEDIYIKLQANGVTGSLWKYFTAIKLRE
jgi:hypothetical protein